MAEWWKAMLINMGSRGMENTEMEYLLLYQRERGGNLISEEVPLKR